MSHYAAKLALCDTFLSCGGAYVTDVTPLTVGALFLLHPAAASLFRANRRRRRGAKPRGLELRDSPAARGWQRPHALTRERGVFCPREHGFVSLASCSRAHDVEQAITPQGRLWGV